LNEYTGRGIPSYAEISGSANANATVTVNLQRATRQENYFWDELAVGNTTSPLWLALTNLAVLNNGTNADIIGTNQGNVFVKQTPEVFNYDADGNLTNDGRWAYTWDGENRLVKMTANTSVGPQYQLNFTYDAQSRRIQKIVATNGVAISTNNFVYDGWNLAAELNPNGTLVRSYIWGTDLSGSAQGAGGVGGLIAISYHGSITTNCFAAFDGNGNIAALINAADGSVSANYEYAPFGEVVRSTGPLARNNPFRFSTKYQDDESDLLYYGYRYYNASTGRWPNRDPIQERGGINLFGFNGNDGINRNDATGLAPGGYNYNPSTDPTLSPWLRPPPNPNPPPTTLSGPWSMFMYLNSGDLGANLTLSDQLQQQAESMIVSQNSTSMLQLKTRLRLILKCCNMGKATINVNDPAFSFEKDPGFVNMGSWQVDVVANCDWKCSSADSSGKCSCTANCQLKVFIHKSYTFEPGYNQYNTDLGGVRDVLYPISIDGQYYTQWNEEPNYFISANFGDTISFSGLTPDFTTSFLFSQ